MVFMGATNLRPSLLEFYQPLLQQFPDEFSCTAEQDQCEMNQRQRGGGRGKEGGTERVGGRGMEGEGGRKEWRGWEGRTERVGGRRDKITPALKQTLPVP